MACHCPSVNAAERVRRLVRHLKGKPRVVACYRYHDDQDESRGAQILTGLAAGRLGARPAAGASFTDRTTSRAGRARSQPRALSSAGAGLYGIVRTSAEVIGIVSMFKDFGKTLSWWSSDEKALAIFGTVIQTCCGFREKSENKELVCSKVLGSQNPADLFTKYLSAEKLWMPMLFVLGCAHITGKDDIGLPLLPSGMCDHEIRQVHLPPATWPCRGGLRDSAHIFS